MSEKIDITKYIYSLREASSRIGQYTPERLKEVKKYFEQHGGPIVEHTTIDEYNFDLHRQWIPEIQDYIYQVSISRGQINTFDPDELHKTFTAPIVQVNRAKKFVWEQLKTWVEKFGIIGISTANNSKFDSYLKFIRVFATRTGIATLYLEGGVAFLYQPNSEYSKKIIEGIPKSKLDESPSLAD